MKRSLINDPLVFALKAAEGCVEPGSIDDVILAGEDGGEGVVWLTTFTGYRFVAPAVQAVEALLNLVHVVCLDEYRLSEIGVVEAVVDVGGFLGFFGVHAARLLSPRMVYVYEPNPLVQGFLEANLAANMPAGTGYIVRTMAVAGERGRALLHVPLDAWPNASLRSDYASRYGEQELFEVEAVDIASVAEEAGRDSLVKIDAEGVEEELAAALAAADTRPRVVLVEAHGSSAAAAVAGRLRSGGYRCRVYSLPGTEQHIVACRRG